MPQELEKARAALKDNKIDNAVIKVNEPLAKLKRMSPGAGPGLTES